MPDSLLAMPSISSPTGILPRIAERARIIWDAVVLTFLCLVVVAGFILLVSVPTIFGDNPITSGTIHAKHFVKAYKFTSCHTVGTAPICTPVIEPARYEFQLDGKDGRQGLVDVTKSIYEKYKVGQDYPS